MGSWRVPGRLAARGGKWPQSFPSPWPWSVAQEESWTGNKRGRIYKAQLRSSLSISVWGLSSHQCLSQVDACPRHSRGCAVAATRVQGAKKLMGPPSLCSDPKSEANHISIQNPSIVRQHLEFLTEPTTLDIGLLEGRTSFCFQPQLLWCFCE